MAGFIRKVIITAIIGIALAITKPSFAWADEKFNKRFNLLVEGRYLFFEGEETTYAELVDFGLSPTGTLDVEPDENWSGKIGFGIQFSEKWDVFASYSGLRGSGKDSCIMGYGNIPLNLFGSYRYYWWDAEAEVDTTYHVVDFEAGYNFQLGGSDMRLSAGARYTDFNQEVNTTFSYFFYNLMEERDVDYWGVGPRLGLQLGIPLFKSSFRLVASANGAVLFGSRDVTTATSIAPFYYSQTKYDESETIYSLDGELGIAYIGLLKSGKMAIVLGYRAENWFGINDTLTNPSWMLNHTFGDRDADQLFHGPFLRLNFTFE